MKRRTWTIIMALMLLAVFAFVVTGCGGGDKDQPGTADKADKDKKVVIKFSHVVADKTPKGQAALKFKELVEAKSNGTMEVQVFPSSSLYGDKEELEALLTNNVQIIAPSVTKLVKYNPSFQIIDMPFLFASDQAAYNWFKSEYGQKLLHSLEDKGMLGLAWWPNGAKHFINGKHPLKTPADFANLKFRVQSGGLLVDQFEALGASAQPIPFSECYQALQNGTVDGTENTFNNIDTQKYAEVQKYLTVSAHGRLDYVVLTNTTFWNGLTDEQKKIIEEAMAEATEFATQLADKLNAESYENLKNSGKLDVYELTAEDKAKFEAALKPVYDKYVPIIGKEYIDSAKAAK
ncbi:TRAP transporter substrate-binding protein [Desulforudis sp. 1088]|uniref:TRAP transporter substrate-binding protein n=1 Tax=unclassified Candidatus Desulforudis TaxID=2635950 RepID=UPI00348034CE